jgi:hypothetical protein
MKSVVPEYDRERVYMSDIKKIAGWYNIVSKKLPFTAAEETTSEAASLEQTDETAPESK